MICNLPKCNEKVPKGRRAYCCFGHLKLGQLNKLTIHDAKRTGKTPYLCTKPNCSRLFIKFHESGTCHHCRSGDNRLCKLETCNKDIPRTRRSTAHFCCEKCAGIYKTNVKTARDKAARVVVEQTCIRKGCGNKFIKTENAQLYCPDCKSKAYNYDETISCGKMFKDFRTTICRRTGVECDGFTVCSDSVVEFPRGAFKYQTNGGVDCWHKTKSKANLDGYGHSFGTCSINVGRT